MKKVYLGLLSFAMVGAINAQTVIKAPLRKMHVTAEAPSKININNTEKGITLFTFDFSNAALWSFADNSGSGDNWVIGTTPPSGSFAINPIASTTAANGFALFDSDLLCSGDQNADVRLVNSVDLSSSPNVSLQFQSFYRKFQGSCYVIASVDGTNWTQFEVHAGLNGNESTTNPTNVQVNLSSVIGGSNTAYIGFRYVGGCDYAWMVDDVKIVQTDDYDLSINGLYWGAEGAYGARLPYYTTPLAQATTIHFGGILGNNGAMTQNDCVFNVSIPTASYSSTSAQGTLAPNGVDTLDATATFSTPTASAASYAVTAGVTSGATDANMADNVFNSLTFSTVADVYARDAQVATSGSFNQGKGYELGNIFDMFANATLKGADIFIHANTTVGAEIYATLYNFDANGNFQYVAQTPLHTVVQGEPGTLVTLIFNGGQPLIAGEPYLLVAGSYGDGGNTDDFVVGTSGASEPQTTFFLDGNDNSGEWFYSTSTPMVRMNFNASLSIDENELNASVNVFPNPAVNEVKISVDGNNFTAVSIVDLTGKVVYTTTVNGLTETTVNTANFAAGMYTVNVQTAAGIATKKLMISK